MKHVGRNIVLIIVITLVGLFIAVPRQIPIKLHVGPLNIDQTIERRNLDVKVGSFELKRNFDLLLGLDLVGGSRLVFDIDTTQVEGTNKAQAIESLRLVIERRVNLFGVSEPNIQTTEFEGKNKIIVELPGLTDTKEAVALVGKTAQLSFAKVQDEQTLLPTDLTGADLKNAQVGFDQVTGQPVVQLSFTSQGAEKFANLTAESVGKPLPIILDGQILSAPVVQEKIAGGSAQISGDFSLEEARAITIQLNAGALPLPISLIEERTVGASLGQEAVNKSIKAGAVGLLIVLIFMILLYRKLGVVAGIGLVIFGIITIALYKIIPVVLTLPGITGFLLSVGMAVDSNILIFERYREERAKGASAPYALEIAFGRAWDSIRDANIATLVTCFILANPLDWNFLNTSGPVRGFAITLALGIGVSLFTGVFVSRNLLRFLIKK